MSNIHNIFNGHLFDVIGVIFAIAALVCGYLFVRQPISAQWKLQRKSLGIEAMRQLWRDQSFESALADVMKIAADEDISRYAENRNTVPAEQKEEWENKRKQIVRIIAYFEVISVGVHEGIYDHGIIKRAIRGQIVSTFSAIHPFIQGIRQQHPDLITVAEAFEKLAKELRN